ncbi:MAG TPA: hypothetical protein VM008_17845 [Phycisphaerae bacterium]|nr:hypothetical protein [Phycisphaerae bacterium]
MADEANRPDQLPLLAYATPSPLAEVGWLFREGNQLVVRDGWELPERCILCGADEAEKSALLTFTWDHSFQVSPHRSTLELRKSGKVRAHLCAAHYRAWAMGRAVGIGGMIVSALVMMGGAGLAAVSENSDVPRWTGTGIAWLMAGFGMMILSLFVFVLRTRTMACRRIEGGFLYLSGAGEAFLRGLPEVPAEMKGE